VLGDGLRIRQKQFALVRRHIQLNGPASFSWMPHDIDHAGAYFTHRDANLPEPNFIAINPENGHGHSAVLLATPVARHAAARVEPLHFYGAVERGIARRIGADRHYSGLITKNPVLGDWHQFAVCPSAASGRGARDRSLGGQVDLAAFQQREILRVAEAPHQYPLGGPHLGGDDEAVGGRGRL
jgi:hypothetical protein